MEKPVIICVDDQREVLAALRKDLAGLTEKCEIEYCESAEEAGEIMNALDDSGETTALLICDHVMPRKNGVDFLIEINNDARFTRVRKLLLTGQATHQDTIVAINEAAIDRYVEKPWQAEELLKTVKILLTEFLLVSGMDYQSYLEIIDQETLYEQLRKRT